MTDHNIAHTEISSLSTADLLRDLASYTAMMGLPFSRPRLLSDEAVKRADRLVASPSPPPAEDLAGQGEPVAWALELADAFERSGKTLFFPEQFLAGYPAGWDAAHRECAKDLRHAAKYPPTAAPAPSRPADREEIARVITEYREARVKFGGTSTEASIKRSKLYDLEETLCDAPRTGGDGWRPIAELAPQTNAVLGRWARSGNTDDGKPYFYWQRATGRFFDHLGERHWCLEGSQTFAAGPFYGEAPTHFCAIPEAPPSPNAGDGTQPSVEKGGGR